MKIGLVGLGRMGAGIAERARRGGHTVVGFDAVAALSEAASLEALVAALEPPRTVWVMVPAGDPTEAVIAELAATLAPGDIVVDGGNSYYKDTLRRAALLRSKGILMLDAGTSGGVRGLEIGFCIMAGGDRSAYDHVEQLLATLAPPGGYAYAGASGAGHYAKMVHNGIEYGLLQAYAEGFHLLNAAEFGYDLPALARLWNNGSIVRSWLLELAAAALDRDPALEQLRGQVDDSGEGRWTVMEAIERGVPAPAISSALYARFASRDDNSFAMRLIAALRNEFGGHPTMQT
jgi:6-phosphogluconate dehydrogenase